jgi:squalene-hopene/tetraprenyl-beta-curcumene cyclase
MTLHLDRERLLAAHRAIRSDLLAERTPQGYWVGRLSSSPLATATAISALVLAEQGGTSCGLPAYTPGQLENSADELYRGDLSELIVRSLHWLAEQQNEDGGWGDTDRSTSNLATTMLVEAAFHLTGVPAKYKDLLKRAGQYVESLGGVPALKRGSAGDRTLVAPVLMNYALADLLPWRKVPALPFELACLPQVWRRRLNLPMMNYALPALLAIGLARYHQAPPRNPLTRWLRAAARGQSLASIQELQPASGGFLEATPLTGFVVMSLASIGLIDHPIVRRGVEFLLTAVRADGSWPIEANLATRNTSQALIALNWNFEPESRDVGKHPSAEAETAIDWLLACQHQQRHPWTGTATAGWAWTNLSGGIPNADDTAAALIALAGWQRRWPNHRTREVKRAAHTGACWLLDLENQDGGWPTFCRDEGHSPYDRGSADVTANVLRALGAWRELLNVETANVPLDRRIGRALDQGVQYLKRQQQPEGRWTALWFGNQLHPQQANPVWGTAQVLLMCRELGLGLTEMAQRGVNWLTKVQLAGGGWGAVGGRLPGRQPQANPSSIWEMAASVEETALAVEALLPFAGEDENVATAVQQGVSWLTEAVLEGRHAEPAPLGFYFARIWYYERLYPQIFASRALAAANRAMRGASAAVGAAR